MESQSPREEAGERTSRQKGNEMAEKFEKSSLGKLGRQENLQQTLALFCFQRIVQQKNMSSFAKSEKENTHNTFIYARSMKHSPFLTNHNFHSVQRRNMRKQHHTHKHRHTQLFFCFFSIISIPGYPLNLRLT